MPSFFSAFSPGRSRLEATRRVDATSRRTTPGVALRSGATVVDVEKTRPAYPTFFGVDGHRTEAATADDGDRLAYPGRGPVRGDLETLVDLPILVEVGACHEVEGPVPIGAGDKRVLCIIG